MTPISNAFSLDLDANLDLWVSGFLFSSLLNVYALCSNPPSLSQLYRETLNAIMTKGHSRVPVYAGNQKNIIGLVLVFHFLLLEWCGLWVFFFSVRNLAYKFVDINTSTYVFFICFDNVPCLHDHVYFFCSFSFFPFINVCVQTLIEILTFLDKFIFDKLYLYLLVR